MTFIHSKTSAKTIHAGPGQKNKGASSGLVMRALSPGSPPGVLSDRLVGRELSSRPSPGGLHADRSLLLGPDPRLRPPQPPAQNLPGRATERPPWEDHGARFLLLPPAPRAEAVARETELAVQRGLGSFRDWRIFAVQSPTASPPERDGEAEAQREAPNPPAGQGHDTRGTKTPGTTAAAAATTTGNASPEERPLVGSCHSPGYGTSLFSIDLSLPPHQPAIPLQL